MDLIQAALKFEVRFQGGVKSRVKLGVGLDSTVYTAMPQPENDLLKGPRQNAVGPLGRN
jgi:hypothetical protein